MSDTMVQSEPEAQLIARVRGGEADAFYDLVRPHERGIYLAALSIVRNEADAEEVVQEAILKAFQAIGRFRGESKFSTWMIQIVMNEARLKLRRARRHLYDSLDASVAGDEEGDYLPCDFADWREIPSEALENSRLRAALGKAFTTIGAKYQQVLVLRDVEQLSIQETAHLLGITEAAVKTRLMRARLMMRDALAPGFDGAWKKGEPYQKVRPF
ncbi:MAG: sigma-70 family RNA polymerase sigma factor [Acidobacteria bacterium]|nr:sigma-70 family RNA polymerase sigma factor [Acidobacteriota bacterium]